ncbi:hypothetical protein [uncultured Thiodictyon sp.]|jgi:flagellar motor protein MotB|uniref:hypothetical protein n=1 Tax=uncultured Thiodictyon sp. TaxID=1846217 RepID=UPI0025D57166|nr:hypothetical protein [uncultured Thiodictyon sp.]
MISDDESGHQVSYWPSISDLFMTLFITAIALVAVVLFVFLVNPSEDVFKGQIIELRNLLGMGPLPQGSDERYQQAFGDTIRKAIAEIKACEQLRQNVDALAACQTKSQRLEEENRKLTTMLSVLKQERDRLTVELAALRDQQTKLTSKLAELERELNRLRALAGSGKDGWQEAIRGLAEVIAQSEQRRKNAEQERDRLVEQLARSNDKPPIITIPSDVLFPSGGATVTAVATDSLRIGGFQKIASEIVKRNANALQNVNTLEIIGHTDSMPMKTTRGNLDGGLPPVLAGTAPIAGLRPGSNNDLGLLRALAIRQAWQAFVAQHVAQHPDHAALEQIQVRTYSAGQTIPVRPNGPVDDADARRIELRLTKLGDPSAGSAASPGP